MNDTERAISLLQSGEGYTCVLCRGEWTLTSTRTGIAPMLEFLDSGADLSGACAADRIVGRAAAMLFCLAGVGEVFGEVMTRGAVAVFEAHGIPCRYATLTDVIVNRQGDGPCPMERAVVGIDDPVQGEQAIRRTLAALSARQN